MYVLSLVSKRNVQKNIFSLQPRRIIFMFHSNQAKDKSIVISAEIDGIRI